MSPQMLEHLLKPPKGTRRHRRRIGRGNGSGRGTYSGKGLKGQKSRSGGGTRPGFEGGQLPLIKRLPEKRGFTNIFKKQYTLVKIGDLEIFEANSIVNPEELVRFGVIRNTRAPIKILGDGEIGSPLIVSAHKFTASALTKIEAAGGKAEEL